MMKQTLPIILIRLFLVLSQKFWLVMPVKSCETLVSKKIRPSSIRIRIDSNKRTINPWKYIYGTLKWIMVHHSRSWWIRLPRWCLNSVLKSLMVLWQHEMMSHYAFLLSRKRNAEVSTTKLYHAGSTCEKSMYSLLLQSFVKNFLIPFLAHSFDIISQFSFVMSSMVE